MTVSDTIDGLLVLDKPPGITSRAAVNRAARWFSRRTRIGHTGTLDPLATGVLVLCVGAATRLSEYVQRMPKTYEAGLLLGVRSDTDDADGRVQPVAGAAPPTHDQVAEALQGFIGRLAQVPPAYSAAKVAGERAYNLAREGEAPGLAAREVEVHGIDLVAYDYPQVQLEVRCGKGTYIRSLARDLGQVLGCGAIVQTLRRTRVGPFTTHSALSLDADATQAAQSLQPCGAAVTSLPIVTLNAQAIERMRQGKLALPPITLAAEVSEVAVFDETGRLAAVAEVRGKGLLQPTKVLPPPRTA
jgi:tRNA pseudouridine55 synthase